MGLSEQVIKHLEKSKFHPHLVGKEQIALPFTQITLPLVKEVAEHFLDHVRESTHEQFFSRQNTYHVSPLRYEFLIYRPDNSQIGNYIVRNSTISRSGARGEIYILRQQRMDPKILQSYYQSLLG